MYPRSLVLGGTVTALLNVFRCEWRKASEAPGCHGESSGVGDSFTGSGGPAWYAPQQPEGTCDCLLTCPQASCWITPASFNSGVLSICRLYYANLFEVAHAYTIVYICLYVITRTLMLRLERNDNAARCVCVGRGECSCHWVQQEQRPTQNGSCLESEAMSFNSTQGRRQNVALRRAGLPCRGAAQCAGCLGSVAAPPGCQTPVQSPGAAGSESIPCQQQPFCSSAAHGSADGELWAVAAAALKRWSGKSCSCGRQQLDRKKSASCPCKTELCLSQIQVATLRTVA